MRYRGTAHSKADLEFIVRPDTVQMPLLEPRLPTFSAHAPRPGPTSHQSNSSPRKQKSRCQNQTRSNSTSNNTFGSFFWLAMLNP
eukprot:g43533.t1